MNIHCINSYSYDSNVYVIQGAISTIVDTGTGLNQNYLVREIKKLIDPLKIDQIILTHEHFDHCGGVKKIFELTGKSCNVIAHKYTSKKLINGESTFADWLGGEMPRIEINKKCYGGEIIKIGDENFEIVYTPGHSIGSICLYSKKSNSLFSGDTIFSYGGFGRYDFQGGSLIQLKESIENIALYDVKNLYPGHESIIEGDGNKHIKMALNNIKNIG